MSWFTSVNYFLKSGITMTAIIRNKLHTNFRLYSTLKVAQSDCVPPHDPVKKEDITLVERFINHSKKLLVITGAGVSTESGIPDYRSEGVGLYARDIPVQDKDFEEKEDCRQRFWARNFVDWPTFSSALPNENHCVLRSWENKGKIHWLVTQNVDGLHQNAGSKKCTELHGSAHRVECLECHHCISRTCLQNIIEHQNPHWHSRSVDMAPDGNVPPSEEQIKEFKVPSCEDCGGILKPEITFHGGHVPQETVHFLNEKAKECDSLLVLGSSLKVSSAYRFVKTAHDEKKKIAIVNIGETMADDLDLIKISAKCSDVLKRIQLTSRHLTI